MSTTRQAQQSMSSGRTTYGGTGAIRRSRSRGPTTAIGASGYPHHVNSLPHRYDPIMYNSLSPLVWLYRQNTAREDRGMSCVMFHLITGERQIAKVKQWRPL